jgi:hypothetical protein
VLEDGGQHDDRVALGIAQHELRGRDAEVGSALQHSLDRIGAGVAGMIVTSKPASR